MAFHGLSLTPNPSTKLPVTIKPPVKRTATAARLLSFQIRCRGNSESGEPKRLSLSQRDAIITLTALSSAIAIGSPDIAEARIRNNENRRKIVEKLEKLKAKAGLSKNKEDGQGKSSPVPPSEKDNNLALELPPLPLPDPFGGLRRSLVEAANNQ